MMVDALWPRGSGRARDLVLVLGFGTLVAAFARIAVPLPFTPVPVTGQTLGVLLAGVLLGGRRGALAMLVYLAEGLAGLPVFAGGTSAWSPSGAGVPVILGPSAGYLFAFPVAALCAGALAERGWDRRFAWAAAAMAAGQILVYALGAAWLAGYVGAERAVPLGVVPFLVGDALKILLAAAVLPSAWRVLEALGWSEAAAQRRASQGGAGDTDRFGGTRDVRDTGGTAAGESGR